MKGFLIAVVCLMNIVTLSATRCFGADVLVSDSGVQKVLIGPGAPAHVIGLERHQQTITLETGACIYGLRYSVARDAKRPGVAIPGEGYIGMPEPSSCNWYGGGFFDLQINGKSIGSTWIHSLTGRSSPGRGTADFVFDAPAAVVRLRFVAKPGGDCLYTQLLLEPKVEIRSLRVVTRCYPSAFVSDAERHVRTAVRDLRQGERGELDVGREWWTLYYDRIYDAGYVAATHRGVGPCAMLWLPGQTEKVRFPVAGYGIDTTLDLKPGGRDLRFVFFDFNGKKNEAATASLKGRADGLRRELQEFPFTDPSVAGWPLAEKQAEIQKVLTALAADAATKAKYARWHETLENQLRLLNSGSTGAIMAEAEAAKTISQWERGLPELKLKALLKDI